MSGALPEWLRASLLTEEFDDDDGEREPSGLEGAAPAPSPGRGSPAGSSLEGATRPSACAVPRPPAGPALHCLLMLCGGYFAGGVFEGRRCLSHKTAHAHVAGHRTSRRPTRSLGGGAARGATAEEAHFGSVVQGILESRDWLAALRDSRVVYLHAPGRNRHVLKGLLQPEAWEKVVGLPVPSGVPSAGRPNYQTLVQAHLALCGAGAPAEEEEEELGEQRAALP